MTVKLLLCAPLVLLLCLQATAQECNPNSDSRREVTDTFAPVPLVGQISVHRRFLIFGSSDGSTFSMISPNVLITAGHSLRDRFLHAHVKSVTIQLGKRKVDGSLQWIRQVFYQRDQLKIVVNPSFQRGGSPEYDYSYAALPENIGTTFFPLKTLADLSDPRDSVYILGYPGDKGEAEGHQGEELWLKGDTKENIQVTNPLLAIYSIYTYHGDSGAPIWAILNGIPVLVGVHGTGDYNKGTCNAGILLTVDRIKELQDFINTYKKP